MKIGLVLEGGALRTIFSSGVCDAMLERNLMADYVIGVSAGIAYGVSYASRQPRRNLEILTRYAPDRRYMGLGNLADPKNKSYFGLEFTYKTIPNELVPFDFDEFEAYPGKVDAVVTNLDTGEAEYLPVPRRDTDFLVLQATCALPLMFPIYRIDGRPFLDGGVADSIPWEYALQQGCDRLVVVLTKPRDFRRKHERLMPAIRRHYKEYPNFIKAMETRAQRYNEDRARLFELERTGKAVVFAPTTNLGVGRIERNTEKLRLLWAQGYQMGVERMAELEALFAEQTVLGEEGAR